MHSAVICLPDFQHAQHSSVRWMIFCCHQRERRLSLCTLSLCPFASSSWGRTQHLLHPCSPEQVGSPEHTDPNVNLKSQLEHKFQTLLLRPLGLKLPLCADGCSSTLPSLLNASGSTHDIHVRRRGNKNSVVLLKVT